MVRGWRVRSGWVVERLAFIVVARATDKTGVAPGLDRAGGHAELGGHLVQGEHAGVAEKKNSYPGATECGGQIKGEPWGQLGLTRPQDWRASTRKALCGGRVVEDDDLVTCPDD